MADDINTLPKIAAHGATRLPAVDVESYNVEIEDDEGFLGDRASKGAFRDVIENWRKAMRKVGDDPFGDTPSEELTKKELDATLLGGSVEAAGLLQAAIDDFAQNLALVIRRFLKLKAWRDTERLAIGGGYSGSRIGELAIGHAAVILKAEGAKIELTPIHHDADEAGLIGIAHLCPAWMFRGYEALVGVDIGGTDIRAGLVRLNLKKAPDLSKANVWKFSLWRHGDEEDIKREQAVESLVNMIKGLLAAARKKNLSVAPFIGVGCPGLIEEDGSIDRGAQNLPGNWTSSRFNLPHTLYEAIPRIGEEETAIVMHNDAVVQGLSEMPYMRDVRRWAIFTIGTGLGNACFTNRQNSD